MAWLWFYQMLNITRINKINCIESILSLNIIHHSSMYWKKKPIKYLIKSIFFWFPFIDTHWWYSQVVQIRLIERVKSSKKVAKCIAYLRAPAVSYTMCNMQYLVIWICAIKHFRSCDKWSSKLTRLLSNSIVKVEIQK